MFTSDTSYISFRSLLNPFDVEDWLVTNYCLEGRGQILTGNSVGDLEKEARIGKGLGLERVLDLLLPIPEPLVQLSFVEAGDVGQFAELLFVPLALVLLKSLHQNVLRPLVFSTFGLAELLLVQLNLKFVLSLDGLGV